MAVAVVVVVVTVVVVVCCVTWPDCLHVPVDGRDVVAREHARLAVAASFPPVGVGVVQDLDEVAASEAQLAFLLRVEVEERLHIRGMLWDLLDVSQKDLLIAGNGGGAVVVHQLIEGVELHHP